MPRRFHFVGSLVLVPAAVLSASFARRAVAGLGVLLSSCYGVVAVWWVASGRADTVTLLALNARVDTVPRYHYIGTLILAVILALVLDQATRRWRLARLVAIALAVWLALAAPQHVATYRSLSAARDTAWHRQVLARIQAAVDAQPDQRVVYLKNRPFQVWGRTYAGIDLPGWAGIYAIAHPQDTESQTLVVSSRMRSFSAPCATSRHPHGRVARRAWRGCRSASLALHSAFRDDGPNGVNPRPEGKKPQRGDYRASALRLRKVSQRRIAECCGERHTAVKTSAALAAFQAGVQAENAGPKRIRVMPKERIG
jgi:hypothetical protein